MVLSERVERLEERQREEERQRQHDEDERFQRLVIDLAVDRAVRGYHRKKDGLEPWYELPPSLRQAA